MSVPTIQPTDAQNCNLIHNNIFKNTELLHVLDEFDIQRTCIMIYSYNKTQQEARISQIYFWNRTLRVSDSMSVHHRECSTVHTAIGIGHTGYADCLLVPS